MPEISQGIVFGGSGFIGSHLLRKIVAKGRYDQVVSVDLAPATSRLPTVKYVSADVRLPVEKSLGCSGATIYNLAAVRTFPGHPDSDYYETNILTSQRIIDFAEETGARKIVFTSTMAVYGSGEDPKTERSETTPVNAYGRSKLLAEVLHHGWLSRNPGARLAVCRPAVIFGVGDNGNFTRLAKALEGGYFAYVGRRNTIKSCGYVGDLIDSFEFALDNTERHLLYNFAYPQRYSIEDIVEAFRHVAGYAAPRVTMPIAIALAAAIPFEVLNVVGIRNPIHRDRIRKLYESTNIVPEWLVVNNFRFNTDLVGALGRWRAESPDGRFR